MWICKICDAEVEDDSREECWRCSTARKRYEGTGSESDEVREGRAARLTKLRKQNEARFAKFLRCLRFETKMEECGTKYLEGDARRGSLPATLGELFFGRPHYDMYSCPNCGKMEFLLDGVSDELRGESEG
jgi:rubrerythrin